MKSLLNYTLDELKDNLSEICPRSYQAKQIFQFIYNKGIVEFEKMTSLAKATREILQEKYCVLPFLSFEKKQGKDAVKYLFETRDHYFIETVLICHDSRNTVCISTQVGCPVKCDFCISGKDGFTRNLEVDEIIGQFIGIMNDNPLKPIRNLVIMGSGEPFFNYENLMKSLNILMDSEGADLSDRRITISTCGVLEGIREFSKENKSPVLAVSLHSAVDSVRDKLVPLNRKYPLGELKKVLREYIKQTGKRVSIEYTLLANVNDSKEDAKTLIKFLRGMKCHVNLIAYNEHPSLEYRTSRKIAQFERTLKLSGIETSIRNSAGQDIQAGCGHLKAEKKNEENIQ